jgi:hypothetical protein
LIQETPGVVRFEEFTGLFIFLVVAAVVWLLAFGGLQLIKSWIRFKQSIHQEDEVFRQGDNS